MKNNTFGEHCNPLASVLVFNQFRGQEGFAVEMWTNIQMKNIYNVHFKYTKIYTHTHTHNNILHTSH